MRGARFAESISLPDSKRSYYGQSAGQPQLRQRRDWGDNSWTPPVYGTTGDGRPVTVSFGQGGRTGHTLISDGHVSGSEFYHRDADADEKGHDHYGPHGESFGDYGKYSG